MRRNDLGGNVFLLLRYTGMRIGECIDLSYDCLRSTGPNQWAIHVPLGKLKTERMVPVDAFVRELVQRLRFFRSLDPLPADGRLLARPGSKVALVVQLRDYLHQVCHSLGLPTRYRPPSVQAYLRHRDASLRRQLPRPDEVTRSRRSGDDHALRRCRPHRSRTRVPTGSLQTQASGSTTQNIYRTAYVQASTASSTSLIAAQHVMEMFRRSLPNGNARNATPQALQPPHQDPRRDKKTPDHLNENGKRLAG